MNKLWKVFIISFTTILFITPFSSGNKIENILRLSLDAPSQVNLEGIREEKIFTSKLTYTFTSKVIYQKPNFIYLEYINPSRITGRMLIDDGKKRIEYLPKIKRTKVLPSPTSFQAEKRREKTFQVLLQNFLISQLPPEKILGRETYVIFLSPRNPNNSSLKIWLDKKTYFTLKKEKYTPQGKLISLLVYKKIQFNKSFSQKMFYRKIPKIPPITKKLIPSIFYNLQQLRNKINFSLSLPQYFPPGYIFQEGELMKDNKTIKLAYTNGIQIIVFFQKPRINLMMQQPPIEFGDIKVRFREGPFSNTLVWNKENMTFVLMGELNLEEMVKIAHSMK